MERRLFLAITLSLLVLLSWTVLIPKSPLPPAPTSSLLVSHPRLVPPTPTPSLIKLSQGRFVVTFNEPAAAIKEVEFGDYQAYKFPLEQGFLLSEPSRVFKKESITDNLAIFVYQDNAQTIIKRFIFHNSNYTIDLEIEVHNLSPTPLKISLPLVLGVLDFSQEPAQARFQNVCVGLKEKTIHLSGRKEMNFEAIEFLAFRDRYFCVIIAPGEALNYRAGIKKINPQTSEIFLSSPESQLAPGQRRVEKFRIYLGPQDLNLISAVNPDWSSVMYYGVFNLISHLLLQGLEFLYRVVHNWGMAIIILSMIIYLLFYPLTLKQMHSMRQMQALQPAIEALRETYKDNPQKLNKEIMELYRRHKVNPFSGCLPLILQVPVFFALYQALMRSIALKGAKFLWIKDLSEPDHLFRLPLTLPILGNEINILPILMSIVMFIQQKISLGATSPASSEQQKLMVVFFPLMFGLIFYRMPAGLVLYWFINSVFMLFYQLRIRGVK